MTMTNPNDASTPIDTSLLSARQERRWFRAWVASLIAFFAVVGCLSFWFLWSAKRAEKIRREQLLNAAAPDPGVTEAEDTAFGDAVPVEVGFYIERVPEVSVRESSWTVVFDVWFRWRGEDLKPADALVVMEGTVESKELLANYRDGANRYERYLVVAKITKPFPAMHMPFDSHLLVLAVENGERVRRKLIFVPDLENCGVSSRVSVPGYRIAGWQALEKPHSYKTTRGDPRLRSGAKSTFSQFRMGVVIERPGWGLYLKMFQALHVAVAISFLACFIKPTDLDPRFGVGVGALFAAVANTYVVSSLIPDTGDFALADLVNGLGILTVLATLIESTISLYLFDRCGEQELSRRLDRVSFKILVAGFVLVNCGLFVALAV